MSGGIASSPNAEYDSGTSKQGLINTATQSAPDPASGLINTAIQGAPNRSSGLINTTAKGAPDSA
jgi:hypothetical protein